ncbi:MAG TPA: zinc-binding dehydrogenase [Candidatus Obscuribacterales bacterium]
MKALVLDRPGTPDSLYTTEVDQPKPGAGEVRIKVHAVGLNPVDYKLAATGLPGWKYPFILGLDVAGVVDAVGPDVDEWQEGDPVYYHGDLTRRGGYGQYTIARARALSWLPEGLSYTEAAALPCAGFTAYQALNRKLQVKAGKTILIHGGAGGVGGFSVQLARIAGLKVIATCSRHNAKFVKDLGAEVVIDYQSEDVATRINDITGGRGVDYIVDTVSPENATKSLPLLALNGGIACVAGLPDLSEFEPFRTALSIHEIALGAAYLSEDESALDELARIGIEFGALAAKGSVRPMVEETVTLEEIPDALVRLSMRHVRGKIVATVPQNGR